MPPGGLGRRAAALLVFASVFAFVALLGAAMALYPGGTWVDRATKGHDFFRNFFCDLTAERALDGRANPGARLAQAGMVVLPVGLAAFWLLVTRFFEARARLASAVRALGVTSSIAAASVPLFPSQRHGSVHALLVFVAGVPGLAAAALATFGLMVTKDGPRAPARLALATVIFAAVDGALYAMNTARGDEFGLSLLPGLQKFAAMSLLAWMGVTAALSMPAGDLKRAAPSDPRA